MVGWQLAGSLPKAFAGVVAYEPVWAIGTGGTADRGRMWRRCTRSSVSELVRQFGDGRARRSASCMAARCKPANAASLLAVPEVGGALVGGASLKAEDFLAIARAAQGGLDGARFATGGTGCRRPPRSRSSEALDDHRSADHPPVRHTSR